MPTVVSKDGTRIAYDRAGSGPAVILVNGALQTRRRFDALAERLAARFTVYHYDRRGRGDSGDAERYAVDREIEDLDAVIAAAGASASVYGASSGATLALKAAARGSRIATLLLWEPIFLVDRSRPGLPVDYLDHLRDLIAADRRGDAVEYFLTAGVGLPPQAVTPMRAIPRWPALEAVAHTLPYDAAIVRDVMTGEPIAHELWGRVEAATLVMDGGATPWISAAADAVAGVLPHATRRTLPGQPHDVPREAVAPVIVDFCGREK
jgi:pimeloyl-ACP methyl ester carboxylesterase